MTKVTTGQDQDVAELSAADEQVLRELTERARPGFPAQWGRADGATLLRRARDAP